MRVSNYQATTLCRSGRYQGCQRYLAAQPHVASNRTSLHEPSLQRQLLNSAFWVIGIPTAITLTILILVWITENVWAPTQQFILDTPF